LTEYFNQGPNIALHIRGFDQFQALKPDFYQNQGLFCQMEAILTVNDLTFYL